MEGLGYLCLCGAQGDHNRVYTVLRANVSLDTGASWHQLSPFAVLLRLLTFLSLYSRMDRSPSGTILLSDCIDSFVQHLFPPADDVDFCPILDKPFR